LQFSKECGEKCYELDTKSA